MLKTKKIIKNNNDVVFIKDSGSIKNDLAMHPNGRNGGSNVVVMMDESSKSTLFDGGGQSMDSNERVRGNGVVIEEPRKKRSKQQRYC